MAIDRIGKGGGLPPGVSPQGPNQTGKGESFGAHLEKPALAKNSAPAHAAGVHQAPPLERLRRGELDVNGYVDAKVHEATAHLHGLGPEGLKAIQKMLREQLATDPGLSDLVKQAAGAPASIPEE